MRERRIGAARSERTKNFDEFLGMMNGLVGFLNDGRKTDAFVQISHFLGKGSLRGFVKLLPISKVNFKRKKALTHCLPETLKIVVAHNGHANRRPLVRGFDHNRQA